MEKDATLAHGAMTFLREKMLNLSDRCSVPVCNNCGIIAIYNKKKADTTCRACGSKDISMCVLPYVCKLLFQDLMAMNIAPRISVKQN
jgi:DNA-directed RNA polymerase II subunit RPB2